MVPPTAPSSGAAWAQAGISLTGLTTISTLVAMNNPTVALVVAGVTAAIQLATLAFAGRKAKATAAPALSVAQRDAIAAGVRTLNADGVHFVAAVEGSTYGGSSLPSTMVLTTLINNGVVYFGPLSTGSRAQTVNDRDAIAIESVEALAQLVNVELDAPATAPASAG